jgi:hypothetical protein
MNQVLLLMTVLGLAARTSLGPGTVTQDRFDYASAAVTIPAQ